MALSKNRLEKLKQGLGQNIGTLTTKEVAFLRKTFLSFKMLGVYN